MKKIKISKEFLIQEYVKNKKSITIIAKELDCSITPIFYRLKEYNIKTRRIKSKYCVDCGIKINKYVKNTKRCHSCEQKRRYKLGIIDFNDENNPFFGKYHTKETKDKIRNSDYHKNQKGDNNAFFGKHHTKKTKQKIREKALGRKHTEESKKKMRGRLAPHGKHIKYKGIHMRSSWEVLYAKYLNKNKIKWLYEPKVFDLGNSTYRPDFYLPKKKLYIEVKGYWHDDAKAKFKRFKKLYPKTKIELLMKPELQKLGVLS